MKPRGASFLTALLSLHYEDNCGRRATKSLGFTFSAATGGSFNRCYKLDNNRLGSTIIISPSTWRDSCSCGPGTLELSLTQRQILAGFRSKQASRLPIANGRESSDLASLRGASPATKGFTTRGLRQIFSQRCVGGIDLLMSSTYRPSYISIMFA
ncbi:GM10526 [Drosophila sechellia]|uniref:GM10526 n=1 Tax=Drosophila sechellia TaxID=7238 RepID=B4I4K3_DROSE|nr:GM10526 [Drosophila sechellia]